jgi:hypothetical protein
MRRQIGRLVPGPRQACLDQCAVLRLLGGLQDERRIGRGVARAQTGDGSKIARIRDDYGVLLQQ